MAKRCIICDKKATYKVKDTPDYYCEECAEENFGDLSVLLKVEDEALRLKEYLKEKLGEDFTDEDYEEKPKKKKKEDDDSEDDE